MGLPWVSVTFPLRCTSRRQQRHQGLRTPVCLGPQGSRLCSEVPAPRPPPNPARKSSSQPLPRLPVLPTSWGISPPTPHPSPRGPQGLRTPKQRHRSLARRSQSLLVSNHAQAQLSIAPHGRFLQCSLLPPNRTLWRAAESPGESEKHQCPRPGPRRSSTDATGARPAVTHGRAASSPPLGPSRPEPALYPEPAGLSQAARPPA